MGIELSASILSANPMQFEQAIKDVESAGVDYIHIDVMDGHFVPNITFGPPVVAAIKKVTKLPLDVHLMIEKPWDYVEPFAKAGANHITVHAEACPDNLPEVLKIISGHNVGRGVSLKPKTPLDPIRDILKDIDMVLLMTVNPGFGGQEFIADVLTKIKEFRALYQGPIEVDGGINPETAKKAKAAGADVLVAGTAIFKHANVGQAIKELRD